MRFVFEVTFEEPCKIVKSCHKFENPSRDIPKDIHNLQRFQFNVLKR